MADPYQVLGISSNATDDEVKNAYRQLARKYHPDNYGAAKDRPPSPMAGTRAMPGGRPSTPRPPSWMTSAG